MVDVQVDINYREITIDGRVVLLTPVEWDIFMALYNAGRYLSSRQIESSIYKGGTEKPTLIRWHIRNIRDKIKPVGIEYRQGFGYRLERPT